MKTFCCGTTIVAGTGAVATLKELGAKRVFLVTDPFFMNNGTAERTLRATGAEIREIFSDVIPDPTVELAAAGAARVREFRPDLIVALGGGSAMDCAKAIRYFGGVDCPLAAIPTTSGSGSEVTDFAVLTHGGTKHPLVDEKLRPRIAILDDDYLMQLPRGLIADSGFDVLAHALEACSATNGGCITACLAREAFALAMDALPRSFSGDTSARLPMHKAATLAGMAFTQAGLGICHALAHALGGAFHVPHGRLNAILLPAVLTANAPAAREKYAAMARSAGIPGSTDTIALRNLKNALIRLRRELQLPQTLTQAGITPAQLQSREAAVVEAALADPCCTTNPVPVDAQVLRGILAEVSGRG